MRQKYHKMSAERAAWLFKVASDAIDSSNVSRMVSALNQIRSTIHNEYHESWERKEPDHE